MRRVGCGWAIAIGACVLTPSLSARAAAPGLSVEDCVAIALGTSALIEEAEAKVTEYQARLDEVASSYYPKLTSTAFLSPMFTVRFGPIEERESPTKWKSIQDWGPYIGIDATLVQPIFSFGRIEAGKLAASERREVEAAALRDVRNKVALEVRRLYYLHLYASSMLPSLDHAAGLLAEAEEQAEDLYERGTGDVTQIDLARLRWGAAEIAKFQVRARRGAALALDGLKHTMGWMAERELVLDTERLSRELPTDDPPVALLIAEASQNRPEWAQIDHGERATLALSDAEFLANMPIIALAGTITARWAPTVENTENYYHQDRFNDAFGGVALALHWDLDPWKADAREDAAMALHDQVIALHRFASTGIPTQVRQAYGQMQQARELVDLSTQGATQTKRWLTFAAAAFASGTGEARDVLEGLAAYLQAKNSEYESLRDYYISSAELDYAVGRARH